MLVGEGGLTPNRECDPGDVDVPLGHGDTHIVPPVSSLNISQRQHSFSVIIASATKFLAISFPL